MLIYHFILSLCDWNLKRIKVLYFHVFIVYFLTLFQVQQVQTSMQSKGGYSESGGNLPTPEGIDVSNVNDSKTDSDVKFSSPNEITITLNNDGS